MDLSTVVGLVLSLGLFAATILQGSEIGMVIDIPSILIVAGGTFAMMLTGFHLFDILSFPKYIKYAFFPPAIILETYQGRQSEENTEQIEMQIKMGILMLSRAKYFSLVPGVGAFFLGIILMLNHLDDPNKIGPSVALALLSIFYSVILGFLVFYPLQTKLEGILSNILSQKNKENYAPINLPIKD